MKPLDWIFLTLPIVIVIIIGALAHRHMRSVADFLSSGRLAERYLLAVGRGEMLAGAVVFVALFEMISKAGFTVMWWQWLQLPAALLIAISGFVLYRYRETRAMTLAQFFELRYSRNFRLFTGGLGFLAGILNFGIIPAVGARIFVHFLGLPQEVEIFSLQIPTFMLLMALFLGMTLFITMTGGFVTIMVTDCMEGIMSQVFYLIIIAALVIQFSWADIAQTLTNRPPGESLLNPFDAQQHSDFNLWFILIQIFLGAYGTMAWQNSSGYNSASLTPHESRMGGILGRWRELGKMAVVTLLAVAAMTYLEHPTFAIESQPAKAEIAQIQDPKVQSQMEIPVALSHLLPIGIKGLFCAILLMGIFGGDSTHLHSWGSIFVQDILVPLRKKPFPPRQHIRILRLAIIGVAVFAFLFGSLFRQTEYIFMWWAVTQGVFVGGAGAAIVGGLYWKKGTTTGAWTAVLAGAILSVGGILFRQIWGEAFPLNGMEISFFAALVAIVLYVVVSLLTCKEDHNMDRLLHRGAYAKIPSALGEVEPVPPKRKLTWGKLIGFDEHFTLGDKWTAGSLFGWSVLLLVVCVVGSLWNLIAPWPISTWISFWHIVGIGFPTLFAVVTGIWFTWGGLRDIRRLFRRLKNQTINNLDDGSVLGHCNLDEIAISDPSNPAGKQNISPEKNP